MIQKFITRTFVWVQSRVVERPRLSLILLGIFIALPGFMAIGSMIGERWYPTGDVSHTELMLRAIPHHFPLVGVAARVGNDLNNQGSTPGASMAYVMYPVYLLFARTSFGVLVSLLVVHVLGIVAALHLAKKFGGQAFAIILAFGMAVMIRSLSARFFLEPWNVWVPVFIFFVFVLLIWGHVLGAHRCLPLAIAVGSFCVQTHISYVPLVLGLLALSLFWRIYEDRSATPRTFAPLRRSLKWSVLIGAVMWLPPVIEQLRPGSGNLHRLWQHFTDPPSDTVGYRAALKAMIGEFNLAGPFVSGPGKAPYDSPNFLGFAGFSFIIVIGGWLAWRRRDRLVLSLQSVMMATTLIGLVSTARVFGRFYDYVIRWMWALAVLWLVASIWSMWRAVGSRSKKSTNDKRLMAVALAALTIAVTASGTIASVGANPPYRNDSKLVGGLAPQLTEVLSRQTDYLLRWHDPAALGGTAFGLLLELERRGEHLFVDQWASAAARPFRVRNESETDSVLWLVTGQENISTFALRDDAAQLAFFDPRSNAERIESDDLRIQINEEMLALGHPEWVTLLDSQYGHMQILLFTQIPDDLFTKVARYSEIRVPGAVFEVPLGSDLFP